MNNWQKIKYLIIDWIYNVYHTQINFQIKIIFNKIKKQAI